jgi:imidazolonepropionase-like amidohydrolase
MKRLLPALLISLAASAMPTQGGDLIAADTVRVYLLGREVGAETYELRRTADGLLLTDEFGFVDRGGEVTLTSSLALAEDLTPRHLVSEGRTYRFLTVDTDVAIDVPVEGPAIAHVRHLDASGDVEMPDTFFTVQGYAPLATRALLIAYWERHGRPRRLTTVPGNPTSSVIIRERGADTIVVGGAAVSLKRYSVRGVAWGREVVWLDEDGRLAAIFTRANILPLDGVRDDLAAARGQLETLAVSELMVELQRLSDAIEPVVREAFALTGARLVDVTGGPPVDDAVVVVRDGEIVAAGPRSEVVVPAGLSVVDAAGKTVVPGLWDMHAHAAQIEWAPAYLAAGVTTVRDMGGVFAFLTAFRDTIEGGRALGPRLLLAGLVDGDVEDAFGAFVAATEQQGRALVDRYHAAGFRQMKLYSSLQPEVVRAISARAHELGMTVTGHVPRSLSLVQALDAGMDHVAHMPLRGDLASPQVEQDVAALVARGAVVDPTLSWGELLGRSRQTPIDEFQPGILGAPWPLVAAYDSVRNEAGPATVAERRRGGLDALRLLHEAGVPIVAGTDYGVPAHSLHRELELYVAAGLTPLEALRAATIVPAEVMGLGDETGSVSPGKRADLLVLDADPLADISNIRSARWVVSRGIMYRCADLWRAAGFTPAP